MATPRIGQIEPQAWRSKVFTSRLRGMMPKRTGCCPKRYPSTPKRSIEFFENMMPGALQMRGIRLPATGTWNGRLPDPDRSTAGT
jgi:hypothetical protein